MEKNLELQSLTKLLSNGVFIDENQLSNDWLDMVQHMLCHKGSTLINIIFGSVHASDTNHLMFKEP